MGIVFGEQLEVRERQAREGAGAERGLWKCSFGSTQCACGVVDVER